MDRMHVRLTTTSIAVLIAVCAVLFGWAARRPTPPAPPPPPAAAPPDGAALFERYCAPCHTLDDLRARERAGGDVARRRAELMQFLESHGDASGDQDRTIVELLIGK
jgi:mono/diheme cytochrome c family protein